MINRRGFAQVLWDLLQRRKPAVVQIFPRLVVLDKVHVESAFYLKSYKLQVDYNMFFSVNDFHVSVQKIIIISMVKLSKKFRSFYFKHEIPLCL